MNLPKSITELQELLASFKPAQPQAEVIQVRKLPKGSVLVDTNVLMNGVCKDNFIFCTEVIEELERHKGGFTEKARNCRKFLRVCLENPARCIPSISKNSLPDDNIIDTAKTFNIPLATGDVAMIVKARLKEVEVVQIEGEEKEEVSYEGMEYGNATAEVKEVWGLNALNEEQQKAINLISSPEIDLISLIGGAGTGKSLIALATALELVQTDAKYRNVIIMRKEITLGDSNQQGFLPGDKSEKTLPFLGGLMDALELLAGDKKQAESIIDTGMIVIEQLGYMRGRSIPNCIIIVDEAQNMNELELETMLTRAGKDTKIILTGDTMQIDAKGLSEFNNGLSITSMMFRESKLAGSVVFKKVVRSRLADEAVKMFNK